MPTGYTYNIKKGISFEKYAMQCARAFGAYVTIRGEAGNKEKAIEAKEESEKLINLSDKELQKIIDKEYKKDVDYKNDKIKENIELKEKYDKMLLEVSKWNPPSANHFELKNFMEQQIKVSYSDCNSDYYKDKKIIKYSIEQYRHKKVNSLLENYEYYMIEWKKETDRVAERNLWIKQLRDSLKEEE